MTRSAAEGGDPACEFFLQAVDAADVSDIVDLVTRARAAADDIDLDRPKVGDLTGVLAFDLDIALDRALGLTRARTAEDALTLTRDLDGALALDFDLDLPGQRKLVSDLELARRLAGDLAVALFSAARVSAPAAQAAEVRAGRLSLGMLRVAVWMLPAPQRPRYGEEFRAELAEMDKLPRRAQLGYALSQLARCWQLRCALADTVAAPKRGP